MPDRGAFKYFAILLGGGHPKDEKREDQDNKGRKNWQRCYVFIDQC